MSDVCGSKEQIPTLKLHINLNISNFYASKDGIKETRYGLAFVTTKKSKLYETSIFRTVDSR